jgi:hypothetical protein
MATHRRPPLTVAPPPELVSFDPDEWPAGEWWQSLELGARLAGVGQGASGFARLGTALDVLREKRRLSEARRRSRACGRLKWLCIAARWWRARRLSCSRFGATTGLVRWRAAVGEVA